MNNTPIVVKPPLPETVARLHNIELKDRWNFYLGLELPTNLQHHAAPIELMVAGVDPGAENLGSAEVLQHRSNRLIIWLYDDVEGKMMRALRALQAAQPMFNIRLSLCGDGGFPEWEAYVYTGCRLEALQHSMLSYEKNYEDVKLELRDKPGHAPTGILSGTITNNSQKPVSMKLLQVKFEQTTHEFTTSIMREQQ